jgi:hypothetical protein
VSLAAKQGLPSGLLDQCDEDSRRLGVQESPNDVFVLVKQWMADDELLQPPFRCYSSARILPEVRRFIESITTHAGQLCFGLFLTWLCGFYLIVTLS